MGSLIMQNSSRVEPSKTFLAFVADGRTETHGLLTLFWNIHTSGSGEIQNQEWKIFGTFFLKNARMDLPKWKGLEERREGRDPAERWYSTMRAAPPLGPLSVLQGDDIHDEHEEINYDDGWLSSASGLSDRWVLTRTQYLLRVIILTCNSNHVVLCSGPCILMRCLTTLTN